MSHRTLPVTRLPSTLPVLTLALLLDLVRQHPESTELGLEDLLRAASYSGALLDGGNWTVPETWQRMRNGWGVYAQNEILSVALQGLFSAQLRAVEEVGGKVNTTEEAGGLLRNIVVAELGDEWNGLTVYMAVDRLRASLPGRRQWSSTGHEIRRAWTLCRLAREGGSIASVARESTMLLLILLARGFRGYPYREFELDPACFSAEDIHLVTLRRRAADWKDWGIGDWIAWLGRRWCIERHLHVALRKLRTENQDTFRIRPLDGSLAVVEVPPVVFTSPRVTRAEQILRDLGLLVATDNWYQLSEAGRLALEDCRRG